MKLLAYAVYGITGGRVVLGNIKPMTDELKATGEWKSDNDFRDSYWAGNEPLVVDPSSDIRMILHHQQAVEKAKVGKLYDCACGNSYLTIRRDIFKDGRAFIYCDVCGAMATDDIWYAMGARKTALSDIEKLLVAE